MQDLLQQAGVACESRDYQTALRFNAHALHLQQQHHFDKKAILLQRAAILKAIGKQCFEEAQSCEDEVASLSNRPK